jgi:hypothetical protein
MNIGRNIGRRLENICEFLANDSSLVYEILLTSQIEELVET